MSIEITEHLSITRNHSTDDIEVKVMIKDSEFVHKANIKVSDWPDYLYYGNNGRANAEDIKGRNRSTLEYVRLQDWNWVATDKKHPRTYATDY